MGTTRSAIFFTNGIIRWLLWWIPRDPVVVYMRGMHVERESCREQESLLYTWNRMSPVSGNSRWLLIKGSGFDARWIHKWFGENYHRFPLPRNLRVVNHLHETSNDIMYKPKSLFPLPKILLLFVHWGLLIGICSVDIIILICLYWSCLPGHQDACSSSGAVCYLLGSAFDR